MPPNSTGGSSAAHTALVEAIEEALAMNGYCAWPTNTGGLKTETGGFVKFGKKGGGDITGILPPHGRHFEIEAKTGGGVQRKNQKLHQKFVVERNGGLYMVAHSVEEALAGLKKAGY